MSMRPLILFVLIAPMSLQWAIAQTPSVSASVTGYTAIGVGAIPQSDWVPIVVNRNDGVLHSEASGEGGSFFAIPGIPCCGDGTVTGPGIVSAFAGGFAAADPGVLHVYGNALAIARNAVSPPNFPATTSTSTVYTNVQVGASFADFLTVNVAGAAIGTAVQVPFIFGAEVVSNYSLGYPQFSQHPISVYARFMIPGLGPQNFSSEGPLQYFQRTELGNGLGLYALRSNVWLFDTHVGDVLPISATFGVNGQANITDSNRQLEFGGFVDGRNTAGIWLGALPSGMTVTSASGHDYTIDPTVAAPVAAVPEPESYALMLAGLACVGFVSRRKKASSRVVKRTMSTFRSTDSRPDGSGLTAHSLAWPQSSLG